MKYLVLLLFMGLCFVFCFLMDKVLSAFMARARERSQVKPPVRYPVLSVVLTLAGLGVLVYGIVKKDWRFQLISPVFLAIAVYGFWYYATTGITYEGDSFTFRLGRTCREFSFGDIRYQRVNVSKKTVCLVLRLGEADPELVLYSNMQGYEPFLRHGWLAWCQAKGLDPEDQAWHDPADHRWFPDQPEEPEEDTRQPEQEV